MSPRPPASRAGQKDVVGVARLGKVCPVTGHVGSEIHLLCCGCVVGCIDGVEDKGKLDSMACGKGGGGGGVGEGKSEKGQQNIHHRLTRMAIAVIKVLPPGVKGDGVVEDIEEYWRG